MEGESRKKSLKRSLTRAPSMLEQQNFGIKRTGTIGPGSNIQSQNTLNRQPS